MTRLGDSLDFVQLLKSFPTFLAIFCKGVKNIIFLVKSILGNFYRHFAIFSGHTDPAEMLVFPAKNVSFEKLKLEKVLENDAFVDSIPKYELNCSLTAFLVPK